MEEYRLLEEMVEIVEGQRKIYRGEDFLFHEYTEIDGLRSRKDRKGTLLQNPYFKRYKIYSL